MAYLFSISSGSRGVNMSAVQGIPPQGVHPGAYAPSTGPGVVCKARLRPESTITPTLVEAKPGHASRDSILYFSNQRDPDLLREACWLRVVAVVHPSREDQFTHSCPGDQICGIVSGRLNHLQRHHISPQPRVRLFHAPLVERTLLPPIAYQCFRLTPSDKPSHVGSQGAVAVVSAGVPVFRQSIFLKGAAPRQDSACEGAPCVIR